jgi:predicted Zn-dependent protease with MMP-like domain
MKMTLKEFEDIVSRAVAKLPKEFRDILEKNQITLIPREEVPEPLQRKNSGSVVFGVFIGVPLGRFVNVQTEPTRIELYMKSFEEYYSDSARMEEQIIKTVIHEIAHYFGFSEKQVRKMGV